MLHSNTNLRHKLIFGQPLTGQLVRIELKAGDSVEAAKTVLAVIEPTPPSLLDARFHAEAESRVKAAESAEQLAIARLAAAREAHGLTEHQLQRAQGLSRTNAISKEAFDAAKHQERIAAETLRASQFALQVAKFESELAKATFVRTRPTDDHPTEAMRLELRSPVSGRVLRVVQESAAVVATGLPLIEVGNPQELEIEIDVLSADAAQIRPGARLYVEQWGGR